MRLAVLGQGLGYSLTNFFASLGHDTIGVDIKREAFENPRLDKYMSRYIDENKTRIKKNVSYTTDYNDITDAEMVFCFVETPLEVNNRLGINSVRKATKSALDVMKPNTTYVMMSTLPVGGSEELFKEFGSKLTSKFVFVPPMITQENFLERYCEPPYLLFGCADGLMTNSDKISDFISSFIYNNPPRWCTTARNVEICKLATNAFGTMKGVFFNRLAEYAKQNGADPNLVCKMVASHWVVGKGYTKPGGAIGGVCLPRDCKELYTASNGKFSKMLQLFEELNIPFE
jgi:nucleotide sugar dehydrogenase